MTRNIFLVLEHTKVNELDFTTQFALVNTRPNFCYRLVIK